MLRVRTVFTGVAGSPWYSNLYFQGETGVEADAVHEKVTEFWNDIRALLGGAVKWTVESDVVSVNPADGSLLGSFVVGASNNTGSSTSDLLPMATQGLVVLRTGLIRDNRRVQGKIFIPGLTEGVAVGGLVEVTAGGIMRTSVETNLLAAGTPLALVVWSRPKGEESPFPGPGVTADAESATVKAQFAVLRSRRD